MPRPGPMQDVHRWLRLMTVLLAIAGPAALSPAQSSISTTSLRRQISRAFSVNAYEDAAELIELYLDRVPNDARMLYNAACAQCQLDHYDASATYLYRALKAGFRDFDHMREDPDLEPMRDHPTYRRIFETLERRDEKRSFDALSQWRETYDDPDYLYETDQDHRIQYATALDEVAHLEMREMLERQADHLFDTMFEQPPSYFVLIAVPTPEDANTYFKGNQSIGGIYQHSRRTLVARNIGGSLRHEFFHAMHYGHMEQLDQVHHLWIQEGLASLYENYEFDGDGSIRFLPNERHNITRNKARAGRLQRWNDIFRMDSDDFMRRAKALYPQVRSMFRFVAERGKLTEWYRAYTRNFRRDRTGALAFEQTFDKSLNEIERDWRRWVMSQPNLDINIGNGDAALGIRSGANLSNDGVLITHVMPGSAAEDVGLRVDDVIVSADGQDTRSMRELQIIIGARNVGQRLDLRIRRNGEYFEVSVRLKPMASGI